MAEKPFDWRDLLTKQAGPFYQIPRNCDDPAKYVAKFDNFNNLKPVPLSWRHAPVEAGPECKKCGAPVQQYRGIAGHSVCCADCNSKNAARQRRQRRKSRT